MKHPNCHDSHTLYKDGLHPILLYVVNSVTSLSNTHLCAPPVLSTAGGIQSPREDTSHFFHVLVTRCMSETFPRENRQQSFFSVTTHSMSQQEIQLYVSYVSYCTCPLPAGGTTAQAVYHLQPFIHRRWTRAAHGSPTALLLRPVPLESVPGRQGTLILTEYI